MNFVIFFRLTKGIPHLSDPVKIDACLQSMRLVIKCLPDEEHVWPLLTKMCKIYVDIQVVRVEPAPHLHPASHLHPAPFLHLHTPHL